MDCIKITIDKYIFFRGGISTHTGRESNTISVYNSGKGIPVVMHAKEQVYVPELIFGHLLTSSNYDDDEKKVFSQHISCSHNNVLRLPEAETDMEPSFATSSAQSLLLKQRTSMNSQKLVLKFMIA